VSYSKSISEKTRGKRKESKRQSRFCGAEPISGENQGKGTKGTNGIPKTIPKGEEAREERRKIEIHFHKISRETKTTPRQHQGGSKRKAKRKKEGESSLKGSKKKKKGSIKAAVRRISSTGDLEGRAIRARE